MKFLIMVIMVIMLISASFAEPMKMVRIKDGDTAVFKNSTNQLVTCRMAYIDAPESLNSPKLRLDSLKCGIDPKVIIPVGKLSTGYALNYFKQDRDYDVTITGADVHGRSTCVVENYNMDIVRDGYAIAYISYIPKKLKPVYKSVQSTSLQNKAGLWTTNYKVMSCMAGIK